MFYKKNLNKKISKNKKGFTLIEILVVIGIIGVLATVVLVAVNPNKQFKQARDSQRLANVNAILNAIGQNMVDHQGNLFCDGQIINLTPGFNMRMNSSGVGQTFDIAECVIPEYLSKLPYDPKDANANYINEESYDTGYNIEADTNGRISIIAQGEMDESNIIVTR